MTELMKINSIRLNNNFIQVTQNNFDKQVHSSDLLYQNLESNSINMVFMTLNSIGTSSFVSATIASKYFAQMSEQAKNWTCHKNISTISIFPHHYRLDLLGFLLFTLGKHKLQFQYMISSNAMLTFVVDKLNCDVFMEMLSSNFKLPESHVPFEQAENKELTHFLKKQYPDTRATYVEKKIKTYGITLTLDLNLNSYFFSSDQLIIFGKKIHAMTDKEDKFIHVSAHINSKKQINLFLLTQKKLSMTTEITPEQTCSVELLSFQGPHFGDRHSIISRALRCLAMSHIPVLLSDCTGASIGIVIPQSKGHDAKLALMDVFETP